MTKYIEIYSTTSYTNIFQYTNQIYEKKVTYTVPCSDEVM